MSFQESLEAGRKSENKVVEWLRSRGNGVINVYEIQHQQGGGPRYFSPTTAYIAPDTLVFPGAARAAWCETKGKTRFTWSRRKGEWQTGVNVINYINYQQVEKETGFPLWLLFLHSSSEPSEKDLRDGSPAECPTGLFGGELSYLMQNESHRYPANSTYGMVYWGIDKLKLLATKDEMEGL